MSRIAWNLNPKIQQELQILEKLEPFLAGISIVIIQYHEKYHHTDESVCFSMHILISVLQEKSQKKTSGLEPGHRN